MKYQILLSTKNKNNIISLSSAELANSMESVKVRVEMSQLLFSKNANKRQNCYGQYIKLVEKKSI